MKLVYQLLLFVATLSFTQHSQHVEGQPINFGIVDKIRNVIHKVLHINPQWPTESSQNNVTTYFPIAQTSQYGVPTYIPISSEGIQQQGEVSTLPPDSVNEIVQDGETSQYVATTYIPISSEDIQQQGKVSTLPPDSANDIVEDVPEGRLLINAPLINGNCEDGYRPANGRCRKVYGRRRRRR